MLTVLWVACRPPDVEVISAEEVGVLDRSGAVNGRDGGPSALAFGRSVWTYGDTVLWEADARGETWHTNSWDHVDPADPWGATPETPTDATGAPEYLIPRTPDELAWDDAHAAEDCAEAPCGSRWAIWPSQPLVDPATGRAWLLYGLFNEAHPSGIGVASWDALDAPVVRRAGLLFPEPEIEWANAPLVHEGHLYAFGCPLRGLSRQCRLGRVPLDAVDQRDAWRFYDGARWTPDADRAAKLFEGAPIMAASWDAALDRWILVYSGPFSNRVVLRSAPQITGPWSDEVLLFEVDGESPYDAQHHAELEEDGGLVQWVTYSRPTGETWFSAEHARWRVELAPAD